MACYSFNNITDSLLVVHVSCREIVPLVVAFQLVFGSQALVQGILRACGRQWDIIGFDLIILYDD